MSEDWKSRSGFWFVHLCVLNGGLPRLEYRGTAWMQDEKATAGYEIVAVCRTEEAGQAALRLLNV